MNKVSESRLPLQAPAALLSGAPERFTPPGLAAAVTPQIRTPGERASAFGTPDERPTFDRCFARGGGEHVGNARARNLGFEPCEPGEQVTHTRSAAPGAPVCDGRITTSTLRFDEDGALDQLELHLDVSHTWRGDLVVQLTSPQGKTVDISNRAGGSEDDVRGSFDLSSAFKGEALKGEWTLTVMDSSAGDQGTLNAWSLDAKPRAPRS